MAEYKSVYTGAQIDAGIAKANTALQEQGIKTINSESLVGSGNINLNLLYPKQYDELPTPSNTYLGQVILYMGPSASIDGKSFDRGDFCVCEIYDSGETYYYWTNLTKDLLRSYVQDYQVLTKNNTVSYKPSSNYHPATKKYVDDSIASAVTNKLGGSY